MEELKVLKFDMFTTLMLAVLAIYFGDFLRKIFPILKKYCLPASVVGGTVFALISLLLFKMGIVQLDFDYKAINQLFYCIFFAASGAAASMALLKKGGKLVVIFAILAAVLAACQNGIALVVGKFMDIDPLISMMTGSIPMTGGHGNAASFAPIAVDAGAPAAMEVAIAAATFGLISGCMLGGPFGNFLVKRFKLEDSTSNKEVMGEIDAEGESRSILVNKQNLIQAVFLMCVAIGIGRLIELGLKSIQDSTGWKVALPIHVCCMFAGIVKLFYIQNTGAAWGILAGQQFVFYIITIFGVSAILYLMFQEKGKSKFALTTYSLLLAGALGNFIDRVRLGFVVDMFQFEFIDFPIFNIADICLTVGVAALFLYILIVERKKEKSGK